MIVLLPAEDHAFCEKSLSFLLESAAKSHFLVLRRISQKEEIGEAIDSAKRELRGRKAIDLTFCGHGRSEPPRIKFSSQKGGRYFLEDAQERHFKGIDTITCIACNSAPFARELSRKTGRKVWGSLEKVCLERTLFRKGRPFSFDLKGENSYRCFDNGEILPSEETASSTVFQEIKKAAEKDGNSSAHVFLVSYFYYVKENVQEALRFAKRSLGCGFCEYFLSYLAEDPKLRKKSLQQSAAKGYPDAMLDLAYFQLKGGNHEQAVTWFSKASRYFSDAKAHLGICYREGRGIVQNLPLAFALFKEAAEEGELEALYELGWSYFHGIGTDQNLSSAAQCFSSYIARKCKEGKLTELLEEKAFCDSIERLKELSSQKVPEAIDRLGKLLQGPLKECDRCGDVKERYQRIKEGLVLRVEKFNSVRAAKELLTFYCTREPNVQEATTLLESLSEKDDIFLLLKTLEKCSMFAKYLLGECCRYGWCGADLSPSQAIAYFQKSAETIPQAKHSYAEMVFREGDQKSAAPLFYELSFSKDPILASRALNHLFQLDDDAMLRERHRHLRMQRAV